MSTSLLYHGFGLPAAYEYQSNRYEGGGIIFVMREQYFSLRCSDCNSRAIHLSNNKIKTIDKVAYGY